jgi:heme/copper-type cytochrome/quinol oxidase subunit 1
VLAFLASGGLTLTGFVLGALIRGSSTLVPAHYHANIGAVTCAFMAVTPLVFAGLGARPVVGRVGRAMRWQPVLYGLGQFVFASGFALAGAHGQARKTYATEQHMRSALEWFGLTVMGVGGLVAVAAGVLFLTWALRAWGGSFFHSQTRRRSWLNRFASTPSSR